MQTNAEYEYYPSIYKITYDLDGGTNTQKNIKTLRITYYMDQRLKSLQRKAIHLMAGI